MSLDVTLTVTNPVVVFDSNITYNLGSMAEAAGIYKACWRPDKLGITKAWQLVPILKEGIRKLKVDPAKYKAYDDPKGWGIYDNFVPWLEKYMNACKDNPSAEVSVCR